MGRRAKSPKGKAEPKRSSGRKPAKNAGAQLRDPEQRLAEALKREAEALRREAEALEQQTATSEILRVISESPTDAQPVFDAIAASAVRLCESTYGVVHRFDGTNIEQPIALCNVTDEQLALYRRIFPLTASMYTALGESVVTRRTVHVEDTLAERRYNAGTEAIRVAREALGYRTLLVVPMVHRDKSLGVITVWRREQRPFLPKQIALVETFANQAVIAIENVRLFTETKEALEQQTATAEILKVIASSPTDTQPVLDAIAENAARLCSVEDVFIVLVAGDALRAVAATGQLIGSIPDYNAQRVPVSRTSVAGRVIVDRTTMQIDDLAAVSEDELPDARALQRMFNHRTILATPLLREGAALGAIVVFRLEVRPFSERQQYLLQTFADQAVIAIENVRLFTELQESNRELTSALDTQTATSDILRVISRSPTDVQPVFDAIVRSALQLLGGHAAVLLYLVGDDVHVGAYTSTHRGGNSALASRYPMPVEELARQNPPLARVLVEGLIGHVPDSEAPGVDDFARSMARARGHRSRLMVPLRRNDSVLGGLAVTRVEPGPFSEEEITLLQTFADQAVIAIENVRLFTELQQKNRVMTEALDQQTATSEVLKVISRSAFDLGPVFETLAQNAVRLCEADRAFIYRFDGALLRMAVAYNTPPELKEFVEQHPIAPGRQSASARAAFERRTIHVHDAEADPEYSYARQFQTGSRLAVPMLKGDELVGVILIYRFEVSPFSDTQITLVETFADQAVIAIENVRLFTELQASNRELTTALDQQTATSDILGVISRSQTDVQPVFDAIVLSARRLLGARLGAVTRRKGDHLELAAFTSTGAGDDTLMTAFPLSLQGTGAHATAVRDCAPVRIADALTDSDVHEGHRAIARAVGYRSMVVVPLLRQDVAVGTISVARSEPGGFTDDEIALLQTFADQAVIAIENARLLSELQETNDSLTQAHARVSETLERQTAMSEILRTISSSPTDLAPTFDAILRSSTRLTGATHCAVIGFDGEMLTLLATNAPPEADESMHRIVPYRPNRTGVAGRVVLDRAIVHIPDVTQDPDYGFQNTAAMAEYRAILGVPMFRETEVIGALHAARAEPGPFSDTQIELFRTFADQAVIAIENVRLFKELEARTTDLARSVQQLTALGEVGRAVSSTLDLETVLTTIVARAVELSRLDGGVVFEYEEAAEEFVHRAATETGGALAEARRATRVRKGEGVVGRTAITLEPVQVPDITVPGAHESRLRENLIESGVRAILAVPMVREGRLIGSLVVSRNHPGDFPTDTIELLRTFATQSALAIQNARLFHEIADKSQQLEAASRHKSEFLANMSHELRTPLNAIIGFSEILAEKMFGDINEKQTEYLQDILESGRHLLSLINDILDLSKIEAGRMELEATDFDLPSAIDNALTLVRERATRRGITLGRTIDEQLGMLHGDERKVKQVLLNLLSNALKFTPEGGRIDVSAGVHDDVAEVSVADTGVGIAPEDQEAVFDEFRQVGTADKKVEGTGLGLALSRKFIELHGGRIWVQSEVGKGSTFRFTLPMS